MSDYFPDWDLDKARGEEAEQLIRRMRTTLATGEAEIKRDDQAAKTGNVYVEYACKTATGWKASGIATTKAASWWWVLYDMRVIVAMPVWLLKNIAREHGRKTECTQGSHPTKGVLLPVDTLLSAARIAVPINPEYPGLEEAA